MATTADPIIADPASTDPAAGGPASTTVTTATDESDARGLAATLVSHGIGAFVETEPAGAEPSFGVCVLPADALRARQILGVADEPDEPTHEELTASARPWLVPALLFAVALVVVPLAAFFITFKLSGG